MKKLFLLMVVLVCTTVSFAQNTLVATLTHCDEIKMFYGANAYRNAYNASTSGDVINLSGGKFNPVDITKAITVRGTGVLDANPTILVNDFEVNIPDSDPNNLTMEGIKSQNKVVIKGTTKNPCITRCDFRILSITGGQRVMFISCNVAGLTVYSSTSQFISCFISNPDTDKGTDFINCVLEMSYTGTNYVRNTNMVNCIIVNSSNRSDMNFNSFPITTLPVNCISVGSGNPFSNTTGSNNISGLSKSIFYDSDILNDLTDYAKAKYLGYDGTPVGMYGGIMPRNMIPSYPRITKMNVAKQTTADGKLSVEIEVSAAE